MHLQALPHSQAFGFVNFETRASADAACAAMDGQAVHGSILRVNKASSLVGGRSSRKTSSRAISHASSGSACSSTIAAHRGGSCSSQPAVPAQHLHAPPFPSQGDVGLTAKAPRRYDAIKRNKRKGKPMSARVECDATEANEPELAHSVNEHSAAIQDAQSARTPGKVCKFAIIICLWPCT